MEEIKTIKTILKPFQHPKNLGNDYLLRKRLSEAHQHLLGVKRGYLTQFEVKRNIIFAKDNTSLPNWLDDLTGILSLYLDTFILRVKYLPPGFIEPISAYTVVGEEKQIELAKHYLLYLYTSIGSFHKLHQSTLALKAKKQRYEVRVHGALKQVSEDIRKESSKYRRGLIKSIVSKLNSLLEEAKMNEKDAFYKGLAHQERIDKFLKGKYSNTWRQTLSGLS